MNPESNLVDTAPLPALSPTGIEAEMRNVTKSLGIDTSVAERLPEKILELADGVYDLSLFEDEDLTIISQKTDRLVAITDRIEGVDGELAFKIFTTSKGEDDRTVSEIFDDIAAQEESDGGLLIPEEVLAMLAAREISPNNTLPLSILTSNGRVVGFATPYLNVSAMEVDYARESLNEQERIKFESDMDDLKAAGILIDDQPDVGNVLVVGDYTPRLIKHQDKKVVSRLWEMSNAIGYHKDFTVEEIEQLRDMGNTEVIELMDKYPFSQTAEISEQYLTELGQALQEVADIEYPGFKVNFDSKGEPIPQSAAQAYFIDLGVKDARALSQFLGLENGKWESGAVYRSEGGFRLE